MSTSRVMPYVMWLGPLLFFAYQLVMRIAPGLVMPELMQKFQIDATSFGVFASLYYFGYAGMQIPVALLLDKFGPRKIITVSAMVCALATLGLVYTPYWPLALLFRFLIGASSAAGFLGTSKVISQWFNKEHYTKMIGLTFTFGLMGAIYGGKPLSTLMSTFGFENVLMMVGWLGFGIAAFIFCLLKEPKQMEVQTAESSMVQDLKKVVLNKELMIIALANFLMVGALEGFADVWGVSYFVATRDISKSDAALLTSTVFFGMLFGGPLLAYISNKIKSESSVTIACGVLMSLIFIVMLKYNLMLNTTTLYVMMFLTGILCCYQVLMFSMGVKLVPNHVSGVAVAFLNCINMLGGSFFHSSIGKLMDYFWTGKVINNIKFYSADTYGFALTIIPLAAAVGTVLLIFRQQTQKSAVKYPLVEEH